MSVESNAQTHLEVEIGSLIVDTVRRFKGLEALVTIVVVDAALAANEELAYVALSRARTRTFLVGQPRHLQAIVKTQAAAS